MHDRESARIGQVHLSNRKHAAVAFHQADQPQPLKDFAKQVSHALECITPADIDGPFALDRLVDKRFAPQRLHQGALAHAALLPCGAR